LVQNTIPIGLTTVGAEYESEWAVGAEYESEWTGTLPLDEQQEHITSVTLTWSIERVCPRPKLHSVQKGCVKNTSLRALPPTSCGDGGTKKFEDKRKRTEEGIV
jgi:hypothetical protein